MQVVAEKRTKDVALWQYAAAFLTMIDGDAKSARQYIQKAEQMKTTSFLQDNIRILRIILDALVGNYDNSFENQILKDLKWLDKKITDNLTEEITKGYIRYEMSIFFNYSMFYYNDMMRKITLSVMFPQYMKRGKEAKALLLAGMASERLRTLTNYRQEIKKGKSSYSWNIDFYTDIFNVIDSVSIDGVIQYKQLIHKKNGTPLDQFLAERCYYNSDYLNEIIGTKYMRTLQFDKAVEYLSLVKSGYEESLNIHEYLCYAPFADPYLEKKPPMVIPDYKLSFATQMYDLQKIMNTAKSKETKSEAMYRYAIGLTQTTSNCWALLHYRKGLFYRYGYDKFDNWKIHLDSIATTYFDEVYSASASRELKAKCLIMKAWLNKDDSYDYDYKSDKKKWNKQSIYAQCSNLLFEKYDKTDVYRSLKRECDTFYSYITSD